MRADGDHLPRHSGAGRAARSGRTKHQEDRLRRERDSESYAPPGSVPFCSLQRVRGAVQERRFGSAAAPSSKEHRARVSSRTDVSRTWRCRAGLRDRNNDSQTHRRACGGVEMSRVRQHIKLNEQIMFESSSPGRRPYDLPPLDTESKPLEDIVDRELLRDKIEGMPELSEVEVVRHFTRLSTWNYHIDLGLYPLGSCTMKHNPRINETVARLPGYTNAHPYLPANLVQGALRVQAALESCLAEISGMDAVTLQPAAGAHGELTGILMIRAYHEAKGNPRRRVLVPDSAHGTNPASV